MEIFCLVCMYTCSYSHYYVLFFFFWFWMCSFEFKFGSPNWPKLYIPTKAPMKVPQPIGRHTRENEWFFIKKFHNFICFHFLAPSIAGNLEEFEIEKCFLLRWFAWVWKCFAEAYTARGNINLKRAFIYTHVHRWNYYTQKGNRHDWHSHVYYPTRIYLLYLLQKLIIKDDGMDMKPVCWQFAFKHLTQLRSLELSYLNEDCSDGSKLIAHMTSLTGLTAFCFDFLSLGNWKYLLGE